MRFLLVAALASVAVAAPQNYFYSAPVYGAYGAWPFGLARTVAAPVAAPVVAPVAIAHSKYHAQDVLGQASFGHVEPLQTRAEVRDALGNVRGSYSYVDPNGKVNVVEYTAGHGGFRVLGANNLPEAPVAPEAPAAPALIAPEPVQDTPEVVAARAEFARLYKEAADAAAADKVPEVASRRRRAAVYVAAPVIAAPAVAKTTVKYNTFEPVDAAVPASTRKIELTEKEQDVYTPLAYSAPIAYSAPFAYAAPYTVAAAPAEAKTVEVKTAAAPLFYSAGFAGYPFYHL